MNVKPIVNFITLDPEIATIVPVDDVGANLFPLSRRVEQLIDVSLRSESSVSY